MTTQQIKLSIQEISEIVSAIKNFGLDIETFDQDTIIEETIETKNVAIVLDIEVKASTVIDYSNLDYFNGTGYAYESNNDGYFHIEKMTIYYQDEECELDKLSMKVINSELDNLKIFE